jgi:hypothetical protein
MTNSREILSRYVKVDSWSEERLVAAMKEYAKAAIDEILSDPSMIYTLHDEAYYNYEMFDKFKKQLV